MRIFTPISIALLSVLLPPLVANAESAIEDSSETTQETVERPSEPNSIQQTIFETLSRDKLIFFPANETSIEDGQNLKDS